jgi:hypothetical protein
MTHSKTDSPISGPSKSGKTVFAGNGQHQNQKRKSLLSQMNG